MKNNMRTNDGVLKGIPHVPFEEFTLKKVEELVDQLERAKPKGARVEVTPMEDSHHSPCMRQMTAVIVHDLDAAGETPRIYAMYQYCPACMTTVRVL